MQYFTDNAGPRTAITNFLMTEGAALREDVRAKLIELGSSPSIVDMVVQVGEFLYARRDDIPQAGKLLGAQMAAYRASNDWHRDADTGNGRANGIQYALMKEAGEPKPAGATYPDEGDYPEPLAIHVPAPAAPTSPTPAG